jgi:tetratricopeptide (TPR) repeat protein
VGIFSSDTSYDRSRLLEAAARARGKKRYRKAVMLYRRVLAVEPANAELHMRLAPLLAATRCPFDAWISFRTCAETAAAESRFEQAAAIYREATRCLPRKLEAWERLAAMERRRGREREALEALKEGSQRLRGRRTRAEAIYLLRRAREIDPGDVAVALDLARMLASTRQEGEARLLLERLADRARGSELRRVRGAQWRMSPSLANSWRWMRAALSGSEEGHGQHA